MKGNKHPIRILLGILIGGILIVFFIRFGSVNASFLLGFLASLICVALVIILTFVTGGRWSNMSGAQTQVENTRAPLPNLLPFVGLFVVAGGVLCISMLLKQNAEIKSRTYLQSAHARQQWELVEAVRASSHGYLLANVLDRVDHELRNSPGGVLSLETIARISALSYVCRPYRILEGDSLSRKKYSPERGHLLLALTKMPIDSVSFERIRLGTSFANAYLRGANLHKADLRGIDLRGASLRDANLSGADLSGGNLRTADLWGAEMRGVVLRQADLNRADLRWANLHEAEMTEVDLGSADLSYAVLNQAKLVNGFMRSADLEGASLNYTDLTDADLYGADARKADMSNANLTGVILRDVKWTDANLHNTELSNALVPVRNWMDLLSQWRITGAAGVLERYQIIEHPNNPFYLLILKSEE